MEPTAEPPKETAKAPTPHVAADVEANKDLAAFSYLYVMSVIVYLLKGKESAFIRHHSKQAMLLFLLAFIAWFIPFLGTLLELIILVGVVVGFLHAAQGQWKDVWLVGPLSRGEMKVRDAWKEIVLFVSSLAKGLSSSSSSRGTPAEPKDSHPSPVPPVAAPGENPDVMGAGVSTVKP